MSVVAPPPVRPPTPDDLESLIEEARRRARRRRLAYGAALLLLGAAAALFFVFGGGGGRHANVRPRGHGPRQPLSRSQESRQIARAAAKATIVEAGLIAPRMGWAMNGLGVWLTFDGGTHWRTITPPNVRMAGDAVARITQIEFVDERHGWISASDIPGRAVLANGSLRHMAIDRTTDGGKTWVAVIPDGCLLCGGASLSFVDALHGFALLGSPLGPRLYSTSNGGATWQFVSSAPFSGAIRFRDRRRGFGLSSSGVLYRTGDGGIHWHKLPLHAAALPQLFGAGTGVVPVRVRDRLVVYVSRDGGATWRQRPAPSAADLHAYTGALPFSAATAKDWVLFVGPTIYATSDGGQTWSTVHVRYAPRPPGIWDVNFTSLLTGWAIFATRSGVALVHTMNGGRDWTPLTPPVPTFPGPPPTLRPCASPCRRP